MNRLIAYFVKQGIFANLVTFIIVVVGVISILSLRRDIFPNISFDTISVVTIYPGASAEDTEKLITSPLEQDLQEVDGIKKIMSISVEGRSVIYLQLDPDQTTVDEAKSDIQDVVDQFSDLPEDAKDPVVTSLESKQRPIIIVSVSGDVSEEILRSTSKMLEREIEGIRDVARVSFSGLRDYEIHIEANSQALQTYRLSLDAIIGALKGQNVSIPAGSIEPVTIQEAEKIIRTVGEFKTIEDIENTVVRANEVGRAIRIKDVAKVTRGFVKETLVNRTNAQNAINLTVIKKEKGDAVRMVDSIRQHIDKLKTSLPPGVDVTFINDSSIFVKNRLAVLSSNLLVGLGLVVFLLALFLPFRTALIVGFGIPFCFFGIMIAFNFAEVSLNLISMMGLIIVIGMLVDDAVVVCENATRYIQAGLDPQEAAIKGTQEVWLPVTASVLTTMLAFLPLTSMNGIMGKFIVYIPVGVILGLLVSLLESFFILPNHVAAFVTRRSNERADRAKANPIQRILMTTSMLWENYAVPIYVKILQVALRLRYLVIGGLLFVVGLTLYIVKNHMTIVLFPPGQIEFFMINLETPNGSSLKQTMAATEEIEKIVATLPQIEMEDYVSTIGLQAADSVNDPSTNRGSEYSQIIVYLTPSTERERDAKEIIEGLRLQIGENPQFKKISFVRPGGGPPVGKPINLAIQGDDYAEVMAAVDAIKDKLKNLPGVSDVQDNFVLGKKEIHVVANPVEMRAVDLSVASVGMTVRAAYEGLVATSIRELDESVDLRVSLSQEEQTNQKELGRLLIPNARGSLIPLASIAKVRESQGMAVYEHENARRQIRITGDLDTNVTSATQVVQLIKPEVDQILNGKSNLKAVYGGENEDTAESVASLKRAFLYAVLGIFAVLILTFKNIWQPVLVLSTIPLGLLTVVWTFFLHNQPFTFLGMIGGVALGGVVVNNAIVLIDFINARRIEGVSDQASIMEAGKVRLLPIFLTTATTFLGIIPTAYGIGGLDTFVVPIALALGWGVLFGGVLTTIIFPVLLAIVDDLRGKLKKRSA